MSSSGVPGPNSGETLTDILNRIPPDELDTAEVKDGVTWSQAMLLGFTRCFLRIPCDETTEDIHPVRLKVWGSVDSALRAELEKAESDEEAQPKTSKDLVIYCLEVAVAAYASQCEVEPEWANDLGLVQDLLKMWQNDQNSLILTEALAGRVLHSMYHPIPS